MRVLDRISVPPITTIIIVSFRSNISLVDCTWRRQMAHGPPLFRLSPCSPDNYPLMKASRSGFTTSAWVVHMP